jgi:hypothetical protein
MTKSKSFGATYSKNCCGVVGLLIKQVTSFGSPTLVSLEGTFWKHFQAIKLSLAKYTFLLQSGKIWKP